MRDIGSSSLVAALALSVWVVAAAWRGLRAPAGPWAASARRGVGAVFALVTVAVACLETLIMRGDYSVAYVADYSNTALPLFYKAASLWAGQAGSLLFWTWLLCAFSFAAASSRSDEAKALLPAALMVLGGTTLFFLVLNVFAASPFTMLMTRAADGTLRPFRPADGQGLNPLLQHPAMVIHPPMLYLGYVGFVVPFAFAMAALHYRRTGSLWVKIIRRWTLTAWFCLGAGILLGARWAYSELGWGGYWAWDPVENASLMPWLTGTAFIHSSLVQQRRGMLKGWNAALIAATYLLCVFGTFMTRSGIVQSVHAFASSGIGTYFTIFLGLATVLTAALLMARRADLRPDHQIESVLSREAGYLFNNLLLLVMMAAVFIGTLFPVFSQLVRETQISLGIRFFNRVQVPLGLLLLFLMGVGPLLAYRRTAVASLRRTLVRPWLIAVGVAVALALLGVRQASALVSLGLCAFVAVTIVEEFTRAVRARRRNTGEGIATALAGLFKHNRSRYGGYVVHFGVMLLFFGFTGQAFSRQGRLSLPEGGSGSFGGYDFKLARVENGQNPNYAWIKGWLEVSEHGHRLVTLDPEKRRYLASDQPSSEVAVRSTLARDLYVVLGGLEENNRTLDFQIYDNPLVAWVWIGGLVLIGGTMICIFPTRREEAIEATVRATA